MTDILRFVKFIKLLKVIDPSIMDKINWEKFYEEKRKQMP